MANIKIDELINFIDESKCFFENKFDLYKLYEYIDYIEKMNTKQKENINKPKKKHTKRKKEKIILKKAVISLIKIKKQKIIQKNSSKRKINFR